MAYHSSAAKRSRSSEKKRIGNRSRRNTMKSAVKKLRLTKDKTSASQQLKNISSLLDKLAGKNIIHKNKAANLKSKLARHVNALT